MFKSSQTNTASYIKDGKYVFFCEIKETVDGKEKNLDTIERELGKELEIITEKVSLLNENLFVYTLSYFRIFNIYIITIINFLAAVPVFLVRYKLEYNKVLAQ